MPDSRIDAAVHAWGESLRAMAAAEPRMLQQPGHHETYLVFTGSAANSTNGVYSFGRSPDSAEIARLSEAAERTAGSFNRPVPWCVQVREQPAADVVRIAARYGLTEGSWEPFLMRDLNLLPPTADAGHSPLSVRAVTGAEQALYVRLLAAGFEAPDELFEVLVTPAVMNDPAITAYVGEVAGNPVSTAMGIVTDGHVGVFNVSTTPGHRRLGYGARITEEVVRQGRAAGADTAYLRASDMAESVYRSLGFEVVEHWTYLTAP
jgi:N-acetylglutamate synthase